MKKISLLLMSIFYLAAGINHFRNPQSYYRIIPPYFSNAAVINITAGLFELIFAVLLLFPKSRRASCYGIICMLIAFIPAHIYMLKAGFQIKSFWLPQWALWVRLIVLQPLLMAWALSNKN